MNRIIKILLIISVFLLKCTIAEGQTYPVQAFVNVQTPAPNKISSFFPQSTGSRINLSLLLTDVSQQNLDVRLSITLEGAGLTLNTNTNSPLPVFSLNSGVPLSLGYQLKPYFTPQSLIASGSHAGNFMQNGVLPEGFYTLTIRVLEGRRNVQISNSAQAFIWIVINDPPQIINPQNNVVIEPGPVQSFFISWMPMHVVTPASGSLIEYKLSMWEVPQGVDPHTAVNTLNPLQTANTLNTSFIWGPEHASLVPGRKYVVLVQAFDPHNEVSFKNDGKSIPHAFTYGQACPTPINNTHSDIQVQSAKISWQALGNVQSFRVEFKPTDEAGSNWRQVDVNANNATLQNLAPSTNYSYKVSPVCGGYVGSASSIRNFTTLEMPPLDNVCTPDISENEPDGTPLLSTLTHGLLFFASGLPVEVGNFQSVPGKENTFDGEGIITFPFFNFGIRAHLKEIQVNLSLQLAGGTVEAVYGDTITFIGGGDGNGPGGPGDVDFTNVNDTVYVDGVIDDVYQNEDGDWVVVNDDGDETVIVVPEDGVMIIDEDGNIVVIIGDDVYHLDNGQGGDSGDPINPGVLCNHTVEFMPGGSMHYYGFDSYKEQLPHGVYQSLTLGGNTLHLPWKSVAVGGSDRLYASPIASESITFGYQSGMTVSSSVIDDNYAVWSVAPPGGEDNLLAVCNVDESGQGDIAGGVRVKSYTLSRHKVIVVPVGTSQPGFTQTELRNELKSIYSQAVKEWDVEFQTAISDSAIPGLSNGLDVAATDYSEHMRQVWRTYVMQRTPESGATYLFIIPSFAGQSAWTGYMPLKSGYGFLTPSATTRDAAHELGHGVFNLRHTFSPNNIFTIDEGTTQNLMDYGGGNELWKYQWDYIHNPEGGWFIYEDSEEGAALAWWLGTFSLKTVSFSGATNNFFTVVSDKSNIYDAPHYRNRLIGSKNSPVAYLKDSKITISSTIKLRENIEEDKDLVIRIRMNDFMNSDVSHSFIIPSDYITIEKVLINYNVNITDFEIDVTLPNHVFFIEDFEIIFDAVIKDKTVSIEDIEDDWWTQVGESINDIYVLFGRPQPQGTLFESVLFMTCRNVQVQAAMNQNTLLEGIWSLFNSSVVANDKLVIKKGKSNSNNHVPLKYYNPHATTITNASMLLKSDGNGQCGSFASLFIEMLLAHGYPYGSIKYVMYGVDENISNPYSCCDYGFLVPNWHFSNEGTSATINNIYFTHTNIGEVSNSTYHRFLATDVEDMEGTPGQNSPNPASMFNNHQIVKVGTTYFDPSYGISYTNSDKLEESIQAIFYEDEEAYYNGTLHRQYRIKMFDKNELPIVIKSFVY